MTSMHRNSDDRTRQAEKRYLSHPDDLQVLSDLLTSVARKSDAMGVVLWVEAFWHNNDLIPDHDDLDVLADVVLSASRSSEELSLAMEQVERLALLSDQERLDLMSDHEMSEDERTPWWRRERFHDVDFDRTTPWKGGRLYSPARGAFLVVSEVTRERRGRLERRGHLFIEVPIDQPVEGVDAVLIDLATGPGVWTVPPGGRARSLSTWSLKRIIKRVRSEKARSPEHAMSVIYTTYTSEDPTDVVESVIGAPIRSPIESRRPPYSIWEGRGRRTMVVMRASGPDYISSLRDALYHWRVAEHPYRVRLEDLSAQYHEERGHETLTLNWTDFNSGDQVAVVSWNTIEDQDEDEHDVRVQSIAWQLGIEGRAPRDWTETAARHLHDVGTIVVEEWSQQPEGNEIPSPRLEAAERALASHDFGEGVTLQGVQWDANGDVWVASADLVDRDESPWRRRARFTVVFFPGSTEVAEAGGET